MDVGIQITLDAQKAVAQVQELADALDKLQTGATSIKPTGISDTGNAADKAATSALTLAKAQAQLALSSGDVAKANAILTAQLKTMDASSLQSIRIQTQLANIANASKGLPAGGAYSFRSGIDAIRFAAAGGGTRAAFYAIDEGIRAVVASGIGLATIIPIVAGITAVAGGGALIWADYAERQKEVILANNEMAESFQKLPQTFEDIRDALKTGLISPDMAKSLTDQIQNASLTPAIDPSKIGWIQKFEDWDSKFFAGDNGVDQRNANFAASQPGVEQSQKQFLSSIGYYNAQKDPKTNDITYTKSTDAETLDEAIKLQEQLSTEALTGYDKERAAAQQKHDEIVQQLTQENNIAIKFQDNITDKLKTATPGTENYERLQTALEGVYGDVRKIGEAWVSNDQILQNSIDKINLEYGNKVKQIGQSFIDTSNQLAINQSHGFNAPDSVTSAMQKVSDLRMKDLNSPGSTDPAQIKNLDQFIADYQQLVSLSESSQIEFITDPQQKAIAEIDKKFDDLIDKQKLLAMAGVEGAQAMINQYILLRKVEESNVKYKPSAANYSGQNFESLYAGKKQLEDSLLTENDEVQFRIISEKIQAMSKQMALQLHDDSAGITQSFTYGFQKTADSYGSKDERASQLGSQFTASFESQATDGIVAALNGKATKAGLAQFGMTLGEEMMKGIVSNFVVKPALQSISSLFGGASGGTQTATLSAAGVSLTGAAGELSLAATDLQLAAAKSGFSSGGGLGGLGALGSFDFSGGAAGTGAGVTDLASFADFAHHGAIAGFPRFHGGGVLGDEMPIVARRGEGIFTPEQMKALGGSKGGSQTIHIVNLSDPDAAAKYIAANPHAIINSVGASPSASSTLRRIVN